MVTQICFNSTNCIVNLEVGTVFYLQKGGFNSTNCIVNQTDGLMTQAGLDSFNSTNCIVNNINRENNYTGKNVLIAQIVL